MIAELITETVQQEETDMKRYITFISCFIVLCGLLGCTDERWLENGSATENIGGIPIEFVMDFAPITPSSRADVQIEEKTEFADGDIIQVVANFYKKNESNPSASDLMEDKSVCCILTYQQEGNEMGKWVNNSGIPLYWPWDADNASFSAFYYPGFDGVLDINNNKTLPVLLDSLDVTTDPLMTKEVEVSYGNAVHLTFKHKCTRLILTDLDEVTGGASYSKLWLENTGINTEEQKNAFQLELKEDKDENSEKGKYLFDFQFVKEEDNNDRVLIGGKTIDITDGSKALVLYLPPGDYSKVSLTRRFGRPLFSWDKVEQLEDLEEGNSYTVSLGDLLGNIIIDDDEEWWTDEEYIPTEDDKEFNLQDFLNCIGDGNSYSYRRDGEEIVVLQEVDNNYLLLMENIDFKNYNFESVDVEGTTTLDGNGHFFKNVRKNVFGTVNGHILNLGITDSNADKVSLQSGAYQFGILARESRGNVDGIRLNNISINVTELKGKGPFVVGSLVGNNLTSPMTNVEMNNIKVEVNASVDDEVLMMGGLVGQNGDGASLENVSMFGDDKISVTNNAELKNGNVYTGGLVGVSASSIINCKVRVDVDAGEATGLYVYTGGLVGSMRNPNDTPIIFRDSHNEGEIRGGICNGIIDPNNSGTVASTGHSATGGLIGYSLNSDIYNCMVSGKVSSEIEESTIIGGVYPEYYTIGGMAGAVRKVEGKDSPFMEKNSVYAELKISTVANTNNVFVGWLAGVAPKILSDNDTYHNVCFVNTDFDKIGREDDSSPTGNEDSGL